MARWETALYHQIKKNASRRGIQFALSKNDMEKIISRANGRCEITGLPFITEQAQKGRRRPYAPSIDRKDSAKGYVLDNCRLVCVSVNLAMNEWGQDVLFELAASIGSNGGGDALRTAAEECRRLRSELNAATRLLHEATAQLGVRRDDAFSVFCRGVAVSNAEDVASFTKKTAHVPRVDAPEPYHAGVAAALRQQWVGACPYPAESLDEIWWHIGMKDTYYFNGYVKPK